MQRIIEIYLNVIEWGPDIYGAEAAAQHYFQKPAAFHASPKLAMEAPQENFAYTLLLSPDFSKPDALAVIRLGQNANEVDDRIRSRDCSTDSDVVKHISLDQLWSLARYSRHLNTTGVAYGQAHLRATSKKYRYQMAADEAGCAEHRDRAGHESSPCPEIARAMNHGPRSVLLKGHHLLSTK